MRISQTKKNRAGYTLIEALVAGVILMGGIAAAAQLTLTLLTQEEMNQRAATALNVQENAATLFRLGFDGTEIEAILPPDPVIDKLDIKILTHDLGNGLGDMEYADVTVEYTPTSADETYQAELYTGGNEGDVLTDTVSVFRSVPAIAVE